MHAIRFRITARVRNRARLVAVLALAACSKRTSPGDAPSSAAAMPAATAPASGSPAPAGTADAGEGPPTSHRAARASCPKVFDAKPEAWRSRAMGAGSVAARDAILAELDLSWPDAGTDDEGKPRKAWSLERASVTRMALGSEKPDDYWVDLRFTQERGAAPEAQAVRSAAVVKQADGTYCALRGPQAEQGFEEHACLGGPDKWPIDFLFVHVTDARRMTVAAVSSSGRCGDGCNRAGESSVAFLDVQGFDLVTVFEHRTFAAVYNGCPWPPVSWREASIEWTGTYPRDVIVVDQELCAEPEMVRPDEPHDCKPTAEETRFRLVDGSYVAASNRTLTAPYKLGVPLVEGGLDDGSGRGWAGRCYKRLQDGKLDAAELDCQRALLRGADKEIRASTFYNLALIAEQRGDKKAACGYLKESLVIRPDNGTTKRKRDELCP